MFDVRDIPASPVAVLSDRELLRRTDGAWSSLGRSHLEMLRLVAEIDRREAWRDDGAQDHAHWVSLRYGISRWRAARWLEAARVLPSLPRTARALASGRLGIDHVVELCRFASTATEEALIAWAADRSSGAVRSRADLERRRSRAEILSAEHDRWLRTWFDADGTRFGLEAQLPADQGAVIERALARLADRMPGLPDDLEPGSDRAPREVRRADTLAQLCSAGLADDPDHDRATLVVHVEAASLFSVDADLAPNGEVEDGPVLTPATIRRLACDARFQLSLDDMSGTPLMLGRHRRTPSVAMSRALRRRDRSCRFPGCERRRYADAHHVVWWSNGGRTDLDNLVLLCGFHHRLVHEGGWRLRLARDGRVEWVRPTGRRYVPGPSPPGEAC